MKEEQRAKKIYNLYCVKEKKLSKQMKSNDSLHKIGENIYLGFQNLKECDLQYTRSFIELSICKQTTRPAFLWQKRIAACYYAFLPVLGAIDAIYDYHDQQITFFSQFRGKDSFDSLAEEKQEQKKLQQQREKVLQDFFEIEICCSMDIVKDVMKKVPSHQDFTSLFRSMTENRNSLCLQGQAISAYLKGYENAMFCDLSDVLDYYEECFASYKEATEKYETDKKTVKKLMNRED